MAKSKVIIIGLAFSALASGQAFRVDPTPAFTVRGNTPPGAYPAVLAIPGAQITLANYPAPTPATAYTDYTGSTPCPSGNPVVLPGVACTARAGPGGNFGFWLAVGNYQYTITLPDGSNTYGPYPFSVGGGGSVSLPITTNLLAGDGMGGAADSGLAPASLVTLTGTQSLTNKTVDGVTPTVFGFLPNITSDVQAQLNSKQSLPTSVKYASQLSGANLNAACTLDANNKCTPGTITGADNSASANAFLATASVSHPIEFVIDGPMGILGPLNVGASPNTTIRCVGSGSIYTLNGSNSNGIQNGIPLPFDPGTTAPARSGTLLLDGCTQYVNRFTFGTSAGNSTIPSNGVIHLAGAGGAAFERGGLGGYTLCTLASGINSAVTAFTCSSAIPTVLPQATTYVIDNEIINCTAYSGAGVSGCTRGSSSAGWSGQSAAATHSSGAGVGTFTWYTGLNLVSLMNLNVRNWHVYDSPSYAIKINNCGSWDIGGSWLEFSVATGQAPNADGLHVDGPSNDGHFHNSVLTLTGDDAIALNLDEGFGGAGIRIQVNDVTCDRCAVGMRMYGNENTVSQINIDDFSGSFRDTYVKLGTPGQPTSLTDSIKSVMISNAHITSQSGNTMQDVVELGANIGTVTLNNIKWTDPNAAATCWVVPYANVNISDIQLINSTMYQTTTGNGTPCVLNVANSNFKKFTLDGYKVTQQYGNSFSAAPYLINNGGSGTLAQLSVNDQDPTNITQLTNAGSFTGITQVIGHGLVDTGWFIPDSVIKTQGQQYNSATDRVPSVLWNGTAKSICATCTSPGSGSIAGSVSINTIASDSLTAMGTTDWAGFFTVGLHASPLTVTPNQRKSGGGSLISNVLATSAAGSITDNVNQSAAGSFATLSWTDGAPTGTGSDTAYIWSISGGSFPQGFSLTVPAGTGSHTAYFYVNEFHCTTPTFTASLSDASASPYVDTSLGGISSFNNARYKVIYNAGSNSQTLNVSWACVAGAGDAILMFQGVALQ